MRSVLTLVFAATLCFLVSGVALAYESTARGPQGEISFSRPTFSKQVQLGPGETIERTEVRLNGTLIRIAPDATGTLRYTPEQPLAPGDYTLKMGIQVSGSGLDTSTFTFSVRPGAVDSIPAPGPESLRALAYTNALRKAAGLSPLTYSAELGQASANHARYLSANGDSGHFEEAGHPHFSGADLEARTRYYGYSDRAAEVIAYRGHAEEAIDDWMATIYHRIPFMDAAYTELGYGAAGLGSRANVLVTGGRSYTRSEAVAWPYPGQTGVPTQWSGLEHPDPLRLYPGTSGPLGYTISLSFDYTTQSLSLSEASLSDAAGQAVPVMRFAPDNDPELQEMVAIIPYKPLAPNTTYTVRLAGRRNGSPWRKEWSFTTGAAYLTMTRASGNTVEGDGFTPGTQVFLAGLPVRNLQVTATRFSFTPPAGYSGEPTDLLVVTPEGQQLVWPRFSTDAAAGTDFTASTHTLTAGGQAHTVAALAGPDGRKLLPETALAQLGLTAVTIPDIDRIYISGGAVSGDLAIDSAIAYVAGRRYSLPLPAQQLKGVNYLPAAFVESLLAGTATGELTAIAGYTVEDVTYTAPAPTTPAPDDGAQGGGGGGTPAGPTPGAPTDISTVPGYILLNSADGKTFTHTLHGVTLTWQYEKEDYEGNRYLRYYTVTARVGDKLLATFPDVLDVMADYDLTDLGAARAFATRWYQEQYKVDLKTQLFKDIRDFAWRIKAIRSAPGLNPTVAAAFTDIGSFPWAEGPILLAQKLGLLKGRTETTFDPSAQISQPEALALMVRLLGAEAEAKTAAGRAGPLPEGLPAWAAGYYRVAVDRGVLTHEDDFQPTRPADRGTVTTWITRAIGSKHQGGAGDSGFADIAQFNHTELRAIRYAADLGIVSGYADGTFRPRNPVTRAEMSILLVRSLRYVDTVPGSIAGIVHANQDGLVVTKRIPADNEQGVVFRDTPLKVAAGALVHADGKRGTLAQLADGHDIHAVLNAQGEAAIIVASRNWYTNKSAEPYNSPGQRALQAAATVQLTAVTGKPLDLSAYGGPAVTFTAASISAATGTARLAWTLSPEDWYPYPGWYPT